MDKNIYEKIIKLSSSAYAHHKIILDKNNNPIDYIFLDVNNAFEKMTGLKSKDIINKKITEVLPDIKKGEFDWIKFYGNVAMNQTEESFEQYSLPLNRWYKGHAFSTQKEYFTVTFTDITTEHKMSDFAKEINEYNYENIDYNKIADNAREISGADYAILNIFDDNGKDFYTKAISGISKIYEKITNILGFNLENKKWKYDPIREEKIKDKKTTIFENLSELTNSVISKHIIKLIDKTFNLGNVIIVKTTKDNKMVGDFTLIYKKNSKLKNKSLIETYADLVGMTINKINAEKESYEKDERLSKAQIFTKAGTWEYNINTKKLYWSKECEKLFGLKEGEFEGNFENFLKRIHPEDREHVLKSNEPIITRDEGISLEYEHRIITKQGETKWVRESAGVYKNENGEPIKIIGFIMDLTDKKEQELALRKQYKIFELISTISSDFIKTNLDNIDDYLYNSLEKVINFIKADISLIAEFTEDKKDYKIIYEKSLIKEDTNSTVFEIENFCWFMEKLEKENFFVNDIQLLPLELKESFNKNKYEIKTNNCSSFLCFPYFKNGGMTGFIAYEFFSTISLKYEDIYSLQLVSEVITNAYIKKLIQEDLIKARNEADKANKSKSLFLSKITHDLKTPLNAIGGFAEIIKADLFNEEHKEYINFILQSSNKMLHLINDLLDVSKFETSSLTLNYDYFNIYSEIEETIKSISIIFEQKNNKLNYSIDDKIPNNLFGDVYRLNRIIQNLLSNSNKFTKNGEINLDIKLEKETIENYTIKFIISDTGTGIKKEKLDKLFVLYYQAHDFDGKGTGLGLALCKELVELMNGEINIESEINKGTTVTFTAVFEKTKEA